MRVLIVVNGDPGSGPPPGPFDRVVAADGGAVLCLAAGLHPDMVVGDMDSLPAGKRPVLTAAGTRFVVHPDPVHKEETDLEMAITAALAFHPDEIVLWGLWGSRPDHTIANVLSLTAESLTGVRAHAYASGWWFQVAAPGRPAVLDQPAGTLVSLIPLGGPASGIITEGLRYPMPAPWETLGGGLAVGSGRGVSNILAATPATIHVEVGTLLVVSGRAEPETGSEPSPSTRNSESRTHSGGRS